ncbi:MAG: cytochrome c oxidase cbb3-type subunit 3 [Candidatus Azotimanducaceae bacterium]|jgi:cytochrome c oxidase cbb3-type subunit 3
MSPIVSFFVIAGTILSLIAFFLILQLNRSVGNSGETTGHNYDGIEEYDNPLPSWWYWMFILSIVFAVGYLVYYPGLGNWPGIGGWTSTGEYEKDNAVTEATYGPIFAQYRDLTLDQVAAHPGANKMGRRLFANNCAICHGAAGQGSYGFPNLTDKEWLWGDSDEAITHTLTNGRQAGMPAWGAALGEAGVAEVSEYVLQLAGRDVDETLAINGATHYQLYCVACHGVAGKGNTVFGAPDLTNEIWLYGNSRNRIQHIVRNGRNGKMPAFESKLGADRVHILAGYVRSLAVDDEG